MSSERKSLQEIQETQWYQSRPKSVQERINAWIPGRLYRYKETRQIVPIYAYSENKDGSCTTCIILVLRKFNPGTILERRVFGIPFEDLEMLSDEEEQRYLSEQ